MSIDTSIVRIRMADRTVVGAGFLVDERHIFTCAHVVTQALGLPEDVPEAPQAPLWLDFPLVAPKKFLTAKVVRWQPRQEDESGDIAVLELQAGPPEGAEAACFAEAEDCWNHPFRAFGFPIGQDDGVWATGQLLGRQATNWIMLEDVKAQGFAVMQGFSGGPVWDMQLQGVVGMVVASSRATTIDTKTAFVIPLDVLAGAWEIDSPALSQRIFLSSAPGDATFAEQLRADLQGRGVVVWNEQKGPDGAPVGGEEQLQKAIRAAQAVVLIVSPQTRASRTVKEHLRLADLYRRQLILVWVGDDPDAQPHHYGWRETTWIDAHQESYPFTLETIEASLSQDRLTSITALLGPPDDRPHPEPRNPYKGLQVFTADDTRDFFGRDRFVNALVKDVQELLATEQAAPVQERLLALIGPSGSGKSSVLMAGLLPKLQQDALPGSAKWVYLKPMVPGKHPLETLALVLKSYFPDSSIKTLREDLDDDATRGLHLLATQLVKKSDTRVVLLVDQFEELFTQTESEAERQQFIELLSTAVTEPHGPVLVLLTIRADFYDRPMQYSALNCLLQAHLRQVLPMDVEDLRATIEQPAAQPDVQLTFEGNLVGDLLFEVQGQVGALPLLQFTLDQLFQHRNGHRLTLQAYRAIGGVEGALSQHAEKVYTSLPSDEHRRLARALFLRLIEPGATEQDTTRRRAPLTEFVFASAKQTYVMREAIDAFVAARLLMTNDSAGIKTIEVSHEAVIREWPRLANWIREAREDIPLQQAVSKDVEEWEHHGKPKDRLYRGTQLKEAQAWATHYMVSEREMAFLRAGIAQNRWRIATILVIVLLLISAVGYTGVSQLLRNVVTNANGNGPGSLNDVIGSASSGSTIWFSPFLRNQTIELSGNININKNLTINGSDGLSVSSGDHGYQITVDQGFSVTINGLAFKKSVFEKNDFILNSGVLVLNHTNISNNNMIGANNAVIDNNRGRITILNSTISNNRGGIYNSDGGQITIKNSMISDENRNNPNQNSGNNCPIYNDIGGTFTIMDSTITHNLSNFNCGSIYNAGQFSITGSTISGNSTGPGPGIRHHGGGIANQGGVLTITDSTVVGNMSGDSGGGIANLDKDPDVQVHHNGTVIITNSTIAGNIAGKSGGGIVNLASTTSISFCTIYDNSANSGGGIAVIGGSVTMSNSIVAGNNLVSGEQPSHPNISGDLISKGFNLIQNMANIAPQPQHTSALDTSNIAVSRFTPVDDLAVPAGGLTNIFDPQGLQNNGGPTKTYALLTLPNNPALHRIPLASCLIPLILGDQTRMYTDQRGQLRPDGKANGTAMCDIGAYEASDPY